MTNERAITIIDDVNAYLASRSIYENDSIAGYTYRVICEALTQLKQSALESQRWIPVSERLPEYHKEVLTCSIGGFIEIQSLEEGYEYWENQHGDWTDQDEVIAWMPLPEPYKAESEDTE